MPRLLNALRHSSAALAALIVIVMLAAGAAGCAQKTNERVEVAADYVRCSVGADYHAMSEVVAEAARPYCYALAAAPPPSDQLAEIVDETWEQDALIIEISFGQESAFMRLSPPTDEAPDEVIVETWNKAGDRSDGTLTVAREDDQLVITHVDGKPIAEVMAVGSGGL